MAYEKQYFVDDQPLKAAQLNHMEDGIAAAEKAAAENTGAATVDDSSLGANTWSSRNIVDKLCPELEVSGSVVTCQPVEGYPLGVVSQILPVQAGSGDPYPPGGGKNLVKYPYENTSMTLNGITFTDNGDGTVTANGTATANAVFSICTENESIWPGVVPGETYTVSLSYEGSYSGGNPLFTMAYYQAGAGLGDYNGWMSALIGRSNTSAAPADMVGIKSYLIIISGTTVANLVLKPQLEPGSVATAYAPYSNVRPISGWTGAKLWRGGKNLLGGDALADRLVSLGCTKDATAGTVQWQPSDVDRNTSFYGHFKENTQYTFIFYGRNDSGGTNVNLRFHYTDGNTQYMQGLSAEDGYYAFTSQADKTVKKITCGWVDDNGPTVMYYDKCGIFEGVVALEDFEPDRGEEFTLDFGQTVYGGSLDWKAGVLTSNMQILPKVSFTAQNTPANPDVVSAFWSNAVDEIARETVSDILCDSLPVVWWDSKMYYTTPVVWKTTDSFGICVPKALVGITDADDSASICQKILDYMSSLDLTIAYKTKKATTIQLAPQEILALEGVNTLYSDTGDTTVTGRADPRPMLEEQKTILERLAALEAAAVNNT